MSYLLTEIALEMLGYKFYDTNGVFHLTNFQQNTAALASETGPDEPEPSLLEFIGQASIEIGSNNLPSTTHRTGSQPNNGHDLDGNIAGIKQDGLNKRRTPARALAKIMQYESEKILNQILARLEKTIVESKALNNEVQLETILREEKEKITQDAVDMQTFREALEQRLRCIDSRPFEKYVRTFHKD